MSVWTGKNHATRMRSDCWPLGGAAHMPEISIHAPHPGSDFIHQNDYKGITFQSTLPEWEAACENGQPQP